MHPSEPHSLSSRAPLISLAVASFTLAAGLAWTSLHVFGTALHTLMTFGTAAAITAHALRGYPHAVLGACNLVTLFRVTLLAFLTGALFHPGTSAWLVFGVACAAFLLDGVDGWLARRSGLVSDFGARFDMETDAGLGAVLALWLIIQGATGVEILILGFTRYAFVLAGTVFPPLTAELPPSFRRKAICVIQISALIALLCPLTSSVLTAPIAFGAAALLLASFAADTAWLLRRKA